MANLFRLFQYDITVAPVTTPASFDPSKNETVAHQPWSEPIRQKIAPALAIALIASGAVIDPFILTQKERVSEDKWHQPLSEPLVKSKPRLPEAEQQFLAFVKADPFPETVTEDRWHQPWSEPVRSRPRLPEAEQQFLAFAARPPIVAGPDSWWQPWSEPVRSRPRLPEAEQQFLAFAARPPIVAGPDSWWQPWREPVRTKPRLPEAEQQFLAFVKADPFPERVSLDKWLLPLSEPVRIPPRLLEARQAFLALNPAPFVPKPDAWWRPWHEPVRTKPRLPEAEQQALAFVKATPFPETVSVDRWLFPLTTPILVPARLITGAQQALALNPTTPATVSTTVAVPTSWNEPPGTIQRFQYQALAFGQPVAEIVTVSKWFEPFADPVRVKARLPEGEQQALAFVKATPFPETASEDRWHQPFSLPLRLLPALSTAAQQAYVAPVLTPPSVTIFTGWLGPLSEPVRARLVPLKYEPLALVLTVEVVPPAPVAEPTGHGSYPTWWDQAQQVAVRLQEQKRKPVKSRQQRPEIIQPAPVQTPQPIPLPDLPREAGAPSLPPPSFAEFNHPDPLGLANQIQDAQDLQDAFAILARLPDPEVEALRQVLLDLQDQRDIQDLLAVLQAIPPEETT